MLALGIDIGASKVAAALVKSDRILRNVKIAYQHKTVAGVNAAILAAAGSVVGKSKIAGIGLGVPCALGKNKKILACANIPALNPGEIAKVLGRTYRTPVIIENDVKAAALAELKYGIGRKTKNFVFLAFGTGIGGAIIIDGKLYKGTLGWAGEFGHIRMPMDWEKIASAQFLRTHKGEGAVDKLAQNIAIGLLTITYALAPEYIVIGGGLSSLWDKKFEAKVISTMKRLQISSKLPLPKVVRSRFGENAGVIGAALLPIVAKR
ncbi:MAG: ROK family protein [Candidatus Sungiibacteriota bacterium]